MQLMMLTLLFSMSTISEVLSQSPTDNAELMAALDAFSCLQNTICSSTSTTNSRPQAAKAPWQCANLCEQNSSQCLSFQYISYPNAMTQTQTCTQIQEVCADRNLVTTTSKSNPPGAVQLYCVRVCSELLIANGRVSYSYTLSSGGAPAPTVRSVATFACSPGYELIGKTTLNCAEDGTWNSSPPRCSAIAAPTRQQTTTSLHYTTTLRDVIQNCSVSIGIQNGTISGTLSQLTVVTSASETIEPSNQNPVTSTIMTNFLANATMANPSAGSAASTIKPQNSGSNIQQLKLKPWILLLCTVVIRS